MRLKKGRRILSLDWDWVTGDCTKGLLHSHCGWCVAQGLPPPPDRGTRRGVYEKGDRIAIDKRFSNFMRMLHRLQDFVPRRIQGPVFVAECHADIVDIIPVNADIWTLDAHMDNVELPLHCGSWETLVKELHGRVHRMGVQSTLYDVSVCAPNLLQFLDRGIMTGTEVVRRFCCVVDAVFICKSSPFTPKEYDSKFNEALEVLEEGHGLTFIGHRAYALRRNYEAHKRNQRKRGCYEQQNQSI